MIELSPQSKQPASLLLPLRSCLIFTAGAAPLYAPIKTGDYWLFAICIPVFIISISISLIFIRSWLNTKYTTTKIAFDHNGLPVLNKPFGKSFDIEYREIKACTITDLIKPKACLELLLVDTKANVYQVCAFRELNDEISKLKDMIITKAELKMGAYSGNAVDELKF